MTCTPITINTPALTANGPQQLLRDFESYLAPVVDGTEILILAVGSDGSVNGTWQATRDLTPTLPVLDDIAPYRVVIVLRIPDGTPRAAQIVTVCWRGRMHLPQQMSGYSMHCCACLVAGGRRCATSRPAVPRGRLREFNTDATLGMPPVQRRHLWDTWQRMRDQRSVSQQPWLDQAIRGLRDVRLRDCLLADAGANHEHRLQWTSLFSEIGMLPDCADNAVVITVLAAMHYLEGDDRTAETFLDNALRIEPNYSLAILLKRGLQMQAPASTVQTAFSNADIEKLLGPISDDMVA